jgi:hypothetical protein
MNLSSLMPRNVELLPTLHNVAMKHNPPAQASPIELCSVGLAVTPAFEPLVPGPIAAFWPQQ